eukprot:TRINITY_DN3215_c0_g1_i2.p2 TRINITY_DN3215_c0_g1~~TRINITY_DN3215_c0_g1_i2.p2  ORF type:complete len:276 (+),score=55.57 TRINITY_DN3215_c0_g1_i2:2472-3299(+)
MLEGSFVGRATFIPPRLTQEVLFRLLGWLHQYVSQFGDLVPDAGQHGLFYSICQSAMYIFCFKHEQLMNEPNGQEFIRKLNFIEIFEANLNPLKLILTEVALEFDKICRKICGIPTITHLLRRNASIVLPTKAAWGGDNQIDTFFPFDPFLLRGSSKHFKGAYQFWQSSPEEDDEDSQSESQEREPRRRRRNSDFGMSGSYEEELGGSYGSYGSFSTSVEMANSWSKHGQGIACMELSEDEDVMDLGYGAGGGVSFLDLDAGVAFKGVGAGLFSF